MGNEFRVLKPIIYSNPDSELNGQRVEPGKVLDFSHLTELEIQGLENSMTIGPKDKKVYAKKLKDLQRQRDEQVAAIQQQQKDAEEAAEMMIAMKKAANVKQQLKELKENA